MGRSKDKIKFNDKKKQAYSFFISRGYTPQQSAGIVANLIAESRLDTTIKGDNESAVGLAQWRLGRRDRLEKRYGDNWHDFENQLDFVDWELKNTEKGAYNALKSANTAAEAALAISNKYERPHPKWAHNEKRQQYANEMVAEYAGINLTDFEIPKENTTFAQQTPKIQEQPIAYQDPTVDIAFDRGTELPMVNTPLDDEKEKPEPKEDKVSKAQQAIDQRMAERNFLINFLQENQYKAPEYKRTSAFADGQSYTPVEIMQDGGEVKNYGITDFAKDAYQAWFNPKNYGVSDYTSENLKVEDGKVKVDKLSFDEAYQKAKQQRDSEFIWNNKRYTTDVPESNFINKYIANNTYPYGTLFTSESEYKVDYEDLMKTKYYEDGVYNPKKEGNITLDELGKIAINDEGETFYDFREGEKKENRRGNASWGNPKDLDASYDALSIHQNQPQKYNSFKESDYKPSMAKNNKDNKYYSFNDKYEKQIEDDLLLYGNKDFINSSEDKRQVKNTIAAASLKNYQYSKGKDDRGEYVAYYDKNDYGNILDIIPNSNPFEIYGRLYYKDYGDGRNKRMYYTDKELMSLDIDKKNFDTLALQRELVNRGVPLPKSTSKEGKLDGVLGKETKSALKDLKNSLK